MPHIEIRCYPGRTEQQKALLAERITADVAEIFKTEPANVSIAIKDVAEADWKEAVWDKSIVPHREYLYKKPEYTCK